jgi:hypothetical protein
MMLNEETKDVYDLMIFVDEEFEKVSKNLSKELLEQYTEKYRYYKLYILLPWMRDYKVEKKETPEDLENELYDILLDFYNNIKNL